MRFLVPFVLAALVAGVARAGEETSAAPLAFDLEDPPFALLLAKAESAAKPIFIDFYLPG